MRAGVGGSTTRRLILMKGKLVIHIGPPKTATTSLQLTLQQLECPGFHFAGVRQPRDESKTTLAGIILQYLRRGDVGTLKADIQHTISDLLSRFDLVVLSEEMFVSHQHNTPLQRKVIRLFELMGEFTPRIVFCLRDPRQAIPSFFQEANRQWPTTFQDYGHFLRSEFIDCFDYEELKSKFKLAGFGEVLTFMFEDYINGQLTLYQFAGVKISQEVVPLLPLKANISARVSSSGKARIVVRPHAFFRLLTGLKKYLPIKIRFGLGRKFRELSEHYVVETPLGQHPLPARILSAYDRMVALAK